MEKKLSEYLHLYLGCDLVVRNKRKNGKELRAKFLGLDYHWAFPVRIMIGEITSARNIEEVKPILRPLESMTEEERDHVWLLLGWNERIKGMERMDNIWMEFNPPEDDDEFRPARWGSLLKCLPYLLSRSFDLFGLIESGLAISSPTKQ